MRTTAGRPRCARTAPSAAPGLIVAPILGDLDGALAEIKRAHAEGLTGGIIIPPQWGDHESYTSYRYDPVWALCQDLELPIHTHSGPGAHKDYGNAPGWMSVYGYETIWFTARPLWFMLLTGVFERYPRLKMSVVEAGSFWAADLLWRTDMIAIKDHGARKMGKAARGHLSMLPSEYFDRNCGIGSSNTRRRELARRYEIGVGNIMWGNDFPHPEGTWPYTREFLKDRFWDIPEDETEKILGLNAAEFYNFDLDKLGPIAERIGPTPEELGQTDHVGAVEVGRPQGRRPALAHRDRGPARPRRVTPHLHTVEELGFLLLVLLGRDVTLVAQVRELLDLIGHARGSRRGGRSDHRGRRRRGRGRRELRGHVAPFHLPVDLVLHTVGVAHEVEVALAVAPRGLDVEVAGADDAVDDPLVEVDVVDPLERDLHALLRQHAGAVDPRRLVTTK